MKLKLSILVLAALATIPVHTMSAQGCGPIPPTPPNPPGCKAMKPVCTCDAQGQHCKYTFQCVPIGS
jgi:hypothetical protein